MQCASCSTYIFQGATVRFFALRERHATPASRGGVRPGAPKQKIIPNLHQSSEYKMVANTRWVTERRVPEPELIPVLGSQPAGDVSHKPGGRLPLLSARSAVILATLKRAATNFAAWWTETRWVWTVCLRMLPDSVAAAIWPQALLRLSPAR